jgi:hypothetical protein
LSTVIALVYIERRQSARCSFAPGAPKEQIQFEQTVGYSPGYAALKELGNEKEEVVLWRN